jgi:hypothetical protein
MKTIQDTVELYRPALKYCDAGEYAEVLIIIKPQAKLGHGANDSL